MSNRQVSFLIFGFFIWFAPNVLVALWLRVHGGEAWWVAVDRGHEVAGFFKESALYLLLTTFVGYALVSRFRAGVLLLDLKSVRARVFWVVATSVGSLALAFGLFMSSKGYELDGSTAYRNNTLELLSHTVLVAATAVIAAGRLQLRENGVWVYVYLIPWQRVKAYELEPDSGWRETRMLRLTSRFLWLQTLELHLPKTVAQTAADYLEQHTVKTVEG